VIPLAFERTSQLTHAQQVFEMEIRRLEWVPGYEAWREFMEDYWDAFWACPNEEGDVEYVTHEELEDQVEQDAFNHLDKVEDMVHEEIRRRREQYPAPGASTEHDDRPDLVLDTRLLAIVEEELDAEREFEIPFH
jgi:hypothetical protein